MTEVEQIEKQISDLKIKLKQARKKEQEARRLRVLRLLEEGGILDMDDATLQTMLAAVKRPVAPVNEPQSQS